MQRQCDICSLFEPKIADFLSGKWELTCLGSDLTKLKWNTPSVCFLRTNIYHLKSLLQLLTFKNPNEAQEEVRDLIVSEISRLIFSSSHVTSLL